MHLSITIGFDAFLTYQLFHASQSPLVQKKRRRSKWTIIGLVVFVIALMVFLENYGLALLYAVFGIAWFFLYPIYERGYYKKHYIKSLKEKLAGISEKQIELDITASGIHAREDGSEGNIEVSKIISIHELPDIFLIQLQQSMAFIITKQQVDEAAVKTHLQNLSDIWQVPFVSNLNWKWK